MRTLKVEAWRHTKSPSTYAAFNLLELIALSLEMFQLTKLFLVHVAETD